METTTPQTLPARIKAQTAPLHQATEKNPLFAQLGSGEISPADYGRYLASLKPVIAAVESALRDVNPQVSEVVNAAEFRFSELLEADLQKLGTANPANQWKSAAADAFVAELKELAAKDPEALLGVVYLIVGSQHGASFMAMALQKKGLAGPKFEGAFYLKGQGLSPIHERWMRFTRALEAYTASKPELQDRLIKTVERGYQFMSRLGDEITQLSMKGEGSMKKSTLMSWALVLLTAALGFSAPVKAAPPIIVSPGLTTSVSPAVAVRAYLYNFQFQTPSDDRWNYPFASTPGVEQRISVFGTVGVPQFNNRDGEGLLAWSTTSQIPAGLGAANYPIRTIRVRIRSLPSATWIPDLSVDEWYTHDLNGDGIINADGVPRGQPGDTDGESSDSDAGRPISLSGMGFGPNYTLQTWTETSPYIGAFPFAARRDPFPMQFQPVTNAAMHMEDNVSGLWNTGLIPPVAQFTETPWAIGVPQNYTPGNQTDPFDIIFTVNLCPATGAALPIRQYFQQQLNAGRLGVAITSLLETTQGGNPNEYYRFYTKEGISTHPLAKAARLDITMGSPTPACP